MNQSNKSLLKRFESIVFDAEYVRRCAADLGLPVIANQRCGSWYVPPDLLSDSCYFKSTDGHVDKWAFNHRRLNLQLLPLIKAHGGCIIVDSTRGPKRFSDALSKTIPIWCAVLNRLLFPNHLESQEAYLPSSDILATQEAEAIKNALPDLVGDARRLDLDVSSLRAQLSCPLKPQFLEPPFTSIEAKNVQSCNHFNIFMVMASFNATLDEPSRRCRQATESQLPWPGYIRGAGDDEDNWAFACTPDAFWQNKNALLEALQDPDTGFSTTIYKNTQSNRQPLEHNYPKKIGSTGIHIGVTSAHVSLKILQAYAPYDAMIACDNDPFLAENAKKVVNRGTKLHLLHLNLAPGKLGSRALRNKFAELFAFMAAIEKPNPTILITDNDGNDLAAGVALAVYCLFFDQERFSPAPVVRNFDKEYIRRKLATITMCKSDISPSRATLQSVHAFLMPKDGLDAWKRMSAPRRPIVMWVDREV